MRRIIVILLALLTRSIPLPMMVATLVLPSQVYLPLISISQQPLGHGLAWATIAPYGSRVNAEWWYRGGGSFDDEGGTPSYPNLDYLIYPSQCRTWMLIFNEPDPNGNREWMYDPVDAAQQSHRVRALCPHSTFVAANVSQYSWDWLRDYLDAGGEYDWIGYHAYCWYASDCIDVIESFNVHFPNTKQCLTEWNIVAHDPLLPFEQYQFGLVLQYVQASLQCSAVFTDRYWDGNSMSLFNSDKKTLNEIGEIYANRNKK